VVAVVIIILVLVLGDVVVFRVELARHKDSPVARVNNFDNAAVFSQQSDLF